MPSRRARSGSLIRGAALVAVLQVVGGCYTSTRLEPGGGTRGQNVTVELSDRGRVALGDALGPFPFRVSGRLTAVSESTLALAVRNVESIRGQASTWTGEEVALPRSGVSGVQSRRLDRGRTALLAGSLLAGIIALFVTRSLTTSGTPGEPVGPSPTPPLPPNT